MAATVDIRNVPIVGDDAFFVTCHEERLRARTEAQTTTDDDLRLEATMVVVRLFEWQYESIETILEEAKGMSSYDPRRQLALDWIAAYADSAAQEIAEWEHFHDELVDYIGPDRAQHVRSRRVDPRLEAVKDAARRVLMGRAHEIASEHGIDLDVPLDERLDFAASSDPLPGAMPGLDAVPPSGTKVCPDCAEEVKAAARKCRFCGYRFDFSIGD